MCQSSGKVIIIFCMYVWCVYMRVHVWVCAGACPHVCTGLDARCLSTVHIEVLPLTWVQSPLAQLVRCQLAPVISCLCILSTGIISHLPGQPDIYMGAGDLNSSPHLCTKVFTDWIISPAACKKKKSFLFKKKSQTWKAICWEIRRALYELMWKQFLKGVSCIILRKTSGTFLRPKGLEI